MSNYKDIMVDIETLGTGPSAVILSIGAVAFNADGVDPYWFYLNIDPQSAVDSGMKLSVSTIMWWMQQSDAARAVFKQQGAPLKQALESFSTFCKQFGTASELRVWGNGATFDNVILTSAYGLVGVEKPWGYSGDRCYRTLKSLYPTVTQEKVGTAHNALDDATYQAKHCINLLRHAGVWK